MNTQSKIVEAINFLAALAVLVLVLAWLAGCGAIENRVEDMIQDNIPPPVVINNYGGTGGTGAANCDGCPGAPAMLGGYVIEISGDTWALGIAPDGGCPALANIASITAYFRQKEGDEWRRIMGSWPLSIVPTSCIGNVAVWQPITQPCPGQTWCGMPSGEGIVEVIIAWPGDVFAQMFIAPGVSP